MGMGINILLREGMGLFLYNTMGMGWECNFNETGIVKTYFNETGIC